MEGNLTSHVLRYKTSVALVLAGFFTTGIAAAPAAAEPNVTISTVSSSFYENPSNSGAFDSAQLSSPPLFSQSFPVIDFNPPANAQVKCTNGTGVEPNTRPFTDVAPRPDGTCSTLPATDGLFLQAGLGVLFEFEAVFSANLTIDAPGQVTFNFFSDDGWVLGAGQQVNGTAQPTYVSGAFIGAPISCIGQTCVFSSPAHQYPVVGAYNQPSAPTQQQVTVEFPTAGTYPVEVDYTECCGGQLALTLGTTAGNPVQPSQQFVGVATGRVVEGVAGTPTRAPTTGYRVSSTTDPLVATFTDRFPARGPQDATRYRAIIDWGDGQKGPGIVTAANSSDCTYLGNPQLGVPPSGQCFVVNASHSYSNPGEYKVGVQITENGLTGSLSTVGVAEIVPSSSAVVTSSEVSQQQEKHVIRQSTGIVTFDGQKACTAEALANISVIVTAHHCYGSQNWTTARFTLPGHSGNEWCGQQSADEYFHPDMFSPQVDGLIGDGPVFIVVRPCTGRSASLQTATGGGLPITFNPPRGLAWLIAAYNARPKPGYGLGPLEECRRTDMSQNVFVLPEENGVLFSGNCPNLVSGASGGSWLNIHELPGILGVGGINQGNFNGQDALYLGDTAMQEYIAAALGLPKP
jgi:hypothetical protein